MRRVTKVKFDGKRVTVHYEVPRGDEPDEFMVVCNAAPAPSFRTALAALESHLLEICQLPATYGVGLEVRGASYSYGGEAEVMGATITALKALTTARAPLVLNTPHLASEPMSETDDAPLLSPAAQTALKLLAAEALRYVDGHREQTQMFRAEESPGTAAPVARALAQLAPKPGSGIESVTLSSGGREVALTAADRPRMEAAAAALERREPELAPDDIVDERGLSGFADDPDPLGWGLGRPDDETYEPKAIAA